MTTKKTAASASAPAKKTAPASKAASKTEPRAPARKASAAPKAAPKAPGTSLAKKTPAPAPAVKVPAKAPAVQKSTSREVMLARVESVRLAQRAEGHFDCFGRAAQGYCDQGDCAFHAECMSVSRLLHSL